MKTLGQILRSYRERKQWTLQQLSRETSVPEEVITALEEERFSDLPTATLVRGYLQLLSAELDFPEETAIALWRRDAPLSIEGELQSHSDAIPFRRRNWWRPQVASWVSFSLFIVLLAGILMWQWKEVGRPPELELRNLENSQILENPVLVEGKTTPDSTVTINTQLVSLDTSGNFSFELDLPPGERTLVIQATDAQGRVTEKVFFITVQ